MSYLTTTREAIYKAVFALVSNVPGIVMPTRTWIPWDQLADYNQPALVMVETNENFIQRKHMPPKKRFDIELYLYARTVPGVPDPSPAEVLNGIIDGIEATLAPQGADDTQTLGGLVEHAWIDGRIRKDPGVIDGQAVCVIPISVLSV